MKVIVVGCGRLGAELAYRLFRSGQEVSLIDQNGVAFNALPADFEGRLHEGDALNRDVLHRAGVEHADALLAATGSDSLNAVIAHVARQVYNVPRVVARNYDYRNRPIYETFGVQIVSAASWGAQRMEELVYHSDVRTVFSAGNGEVEVYEATILAAWDGHRVADLLHSAGSVVISVTRAGRSMLPEAEMVLHTDDIVLFGATVEGVEAIRERMGLVRQEVRR